MVEAFGEELRMTELSLISEQEPPSVSPPRVSVVVPNYNHAPYLRQRIDSILDQTWQDFELIILDDCSPDGSRDVIMEYVNDPRVRFEFNERNSGSVFRQWNKGLAMAKGEFVWIAESDDYSDPGFLATMVERLERNPGVGVAFCNSHLVIGSEVSAQLERWFHEFAERYREDFIANGPQYVAEQMLFFNTIPNASSAVFRREVAEQAGPADDSYKLSGDWLFWIRLMQISDLAYIAAPLNFYRHHAATERSRHSATGVPLEEAMRVALEVLAAPLVSEGNRQLIRANLVERYVQTRLQESQGIPSERLRRIDRLAGRLDPLARFKFWVRATGLGWLWLGLRRRIRMVGGCLKFR